jgi:glycosyltransferase involved in cell wall biosynthesis
LPLSARLSGSASAAGLTWFVAGPTGYVISKLIGSRFVYHNEGFYPDEQVDGGVWKENSFIHRLAKRIEGFLYDHADGIIVLSERAKNVLNSRTSVRRRQRPVIVVPSAVDLRAFLLPAVPRNRPSPPSLVYLGSVGLRYRLDDAGRFTLAL